MTTFYKTFLVILILIIAVNFYAIDYHTDITSEDNMKNVFSIGFGIIGVILVFVLNTWRKIGLKK